MTSLDRDREPRKPLRAVAEGYSVYDYPRDEAMAVAERAAVLFGSLFDRAVPSIGLAGQKVRRMYLEVRGSPFVNFSSSERGNGPGVVAETQDGDLALEVYRCKGKILTGDGEYTRWDTELRAPDWRLIAISKSELV